MIDTILKPFDFALSLSVDEQFQITVAGCSVGFTCAAILRELVANPSVKWAARVMGCGAFFALVCFGEYATREVQERDSELMARKAHDAQSIAAQTSFVETQIETPDGFRFSWHDGARGFESMPAGDRRIARGDNSGGRSNRSHAGTSDGFNDVSNAKHAASIATSGAADSINKGGVDF